MGVAEIVLLVFTGYFVVSLVTLPFIDSLWISELPVLALVQVPKTTLAEWMLSGVVLPAIRAMGMSRGSPSPDLMLARPYAMALAYLVVLVLVSLFWVALSRARRYTHWLLWAMLLLAAIDHFVLLYHANTPGLSIY